MAAISAATFDALSQAIDVTLVPHGFVPLRVERNGPFGSHYSVFAKESTAYRIVWDGKESWLGAEVSDNFGGGGTSNWTDLVLFRVGRFGCDRDVEALTTKLVDALESHLKTSAA